MSGKLIFVSGLTGAGKTTLVGEALKAADNLEVLLTYTTRPRRDSEQSSYEYVFVTDDEYEQLKSRSNNWDETIYNGYRYASDAEKFISALHSGVNVIVSVTPDMNDIRTMAAIYKQDPVKIWIDTPKAVAAKRIQVDAKRSQRVENESVKKYFDIVFTPTNSLAEDTKSFVALISSITQQE